MSQQINLFNPIFLQQKKLFSALTLLQTFAMVSCGALLVAMFALFQSSALKKSADVVTLQLRSAETQVAKMRAEAVVPVKSKVLEQAIAKTEAELIAKQRIATILQKSDFGNTNGYSLYLSAFARQIPAGVWLTGFNIAGGASEISLQGRTLKPESVLTYISQLKSESAMQGKSFASLQMQLPQPIAATGKPATTTTTTVTSADAAPFIEFELRSSTASEAEITAGAKPK